MKIAIRKEPNGSIYIDNNLRDDIAYTEPPYNFTITEVIAEDCEASDFNDDLTFNIEKYNARKQKKLNQNKILKLKQNLSNTDYLCLKYAEGELTEEEYAPIKAHRKEWREEINRLEEELNNGNNGQ